MTDQNREIRTKNEEDVSADDRSLIEGLPEESFLQKRKRSENADRKNTTARGKASTEVPALPLTTEELSDTENMIETILQEWCQKETNRFSQNGH